MGIEGLLTPVSTSYKTSSEDVSEALTEVVPKHQEADGKEERLLGPATTPEEALRILRHEPDYALLASTLRYLSGTKLEILLSPNPLSAQLVHVLVSNTVLDYWSIISTNRDDSPVGRRSKSSTELRSLLLCLRSIIGLNAILMSLKHHIEQSKESRKAPGKTSSQEAIRTYLQLLQVLLDGSDVAFTIWKRIHTVSETLSQPRVLWQEFLSVVGGSKILSYAAEAETILNGLTKGVHEEYWIADGSQYSKWLAGNFVHMASKSRSITDMQTRSCAELLSRCLRLGYSDSVVQHILSSLLLPPNSNRAQFRNVLSLLSSTEQKNLLYAVLKICSRQYLATGASTEDTAQWWRADATAVAAAASLIKEVILDDKTRTQQLMLWLTSTSEAGVGDGVAIRRAVLAVLSQDKTYTEQILEKALRNFGDQLYIKHTPTMQQEVHCQVLLLAAGYLHRQAPISLKKMMRSGAHLSLVSNRLAATSPRCRFLGMIVGEALSGLVDRDDTRMDFKVDDTKTAEAKWYKSLVDVADGIGTLDALQAGKVEGLQAASLATPTQRPKSKQANAGSKIISIEEVSTDEEEGSSEHGLAPYAKPDSDAEDSDEDATLVIRNKPTAPVYIRDLITYLRDSENYDRQKLGLSTAASLIRRKANFGTEVTDHAVELAALLVGIQDKYELENFQDMRLQGMIAILIALPSKMGQWFAKTFFDGDYSLSQQASILTTLSLGARELGGYAAEDADLSSTKPLPNTTDFPSKILPPKSHKYYVAAPPPTQIDTLSTHLTQTMITPMAAKLADTLTGPSILKIRTFSSRMEVEAKRKKPIANTFARIVAESFFFPLTGRFFMHLRAYGSRSSFRSVIFQPYLLAHLIKTLALLLHASGPSTLSLPQMTAEFWDLLLGLRAQSGGETGVIEALLFAFLTILEINEEKRSLVDAHGKQMLETQEWVEGIFGRFSGGGDEDEKVKMLAAGVLVRIRETVEKFQRVMMGDLASF